MRLLTEQEVSDMLQVSRRTVKRLRIPCVRLGRLVRWELAAVTKFVEARRSRA
jgi:excisionase family DNA binding protein